MLAASKSPKRGLTILPVAFQVKAWLMSFLNENLCEDEDKISEMFKELYDLQDH